MIQAWIFVETLFIPSQSKKVYTLGYDFRKPLWKRFKEIIFIIVLIFFRQNVIQTHVVISSIKIYSNVLFIS